MTQGHDPHSTESQQVMLFDDLLETVAPSRTGTKAPRKPRMVSVGDAVNFRLPVSGEEVTCTFRLLNPADCVPSPLNRRLQSLLSLANTEVAALVESIRNEGQREPVLARPVMVAGKTRYEIVYGTRRRFAVEQLARELEGGLKLKAWVADDGMPDADARRLAVSENENRAAISAWETAQYLKGELARNEGWTHEVLANAEGMDRTVVTKYLLIADVDERFVRLLSCPSGMSLKGGLALRSLINKQRDHVEAALAAIAGSESVPFADAASLLRALRAHIEASQPKALPRNVKTALSTRSGTVIGHIAHHRSKPGCFSIGLSGLSDEQAMRVKQAIEQALS